MSKWPIFVALLALAALVAGAFGALANQIGYSVGASYFHDMKFIEAGLSEGLQNRIGASLVGLREGSRLGLLVSLPACILGLVMIRSRQTYFSSGVSAIGVAVVIALACAMAGLTLGMIAPAYTADRPIPETVTDTDSFLRAAMMQQGAFVGALIAVPVALWAMWRGAQSDPA